MSHVNMQRLLTYAQRVETDVVTGGCPANRLFLGDKLCVSDHLIVPHSYMDDETVASADVTFKLRLDIVMRRARNRGESRWYWEPIHFERVSLFFYHTNFDSLLEYAANWLEEHDDVETGEYELYKDSDLRRGYSVRTVNYPQIGRIRHYTNPLQEND